jgi:glycosyltransferase involved in cell wall biosynthesis
VINSPLRVLVVGHTYVVGVNQGKLRAMGRNGRVKIGLLAPTYWKASGQKRVLQLETPHPDVRMYPARVWLGGRGGAYIYPPLSVRRALKDFRPHILHVEQEVFSLSAFEMALWAEATGTPLTVFCWENTDRRLPVFRRWSRRWVLNRAQLIVAGSRDAAYWLRSWGYRNRIEVLPQLGVDPLLFSHRRSKPIHGKTFIIGYVGRLVHQKGVDLILDALRTLLKQEYNCRLVLCGTGNEERELRKAAMRQGIADFVVWRGEVRHDAVPAEMAAFDVLVLPSRGVSGWREQFGHVLVEAMSMGVPVIGSTCGEIPNVIGRQDLLFPEDDSQALAVILERMIREPSWRQEAGDYGVNMVRELYTHERIAERLVTLWEEIMSGQPMGNHA